MPPFAHAGSTCWNLSGHIAASHVAPSAINAAAPSTPEPAMGVETMPEPTAAAPLAAAPLAAAPLAAAPLEKPIDEDLKFSASSLKNCGTSPSAPLSTSCVLDTLLDRSDSLAVFHASPSNSGFDAPSSVSAPSRLAPPNRATVSFARYRRVRSSRVFSSKSNTVPSYAAPSTRRTLRFPSAAFAFAFAFAVVSRPPIAAIIAIIPSDAIAALAIVRRFIRSPSPAPSLAPRASRASSSSSSRRRRASRSSSRRPSSDADSDARAASRDRASSGARMSGARVVVVRAVARRRASRDAAR